MYYRCYKLCRVYYVVILVLAAELISIVLVEFYT